MDRIFLLILSILNFKHGFRLCSAGEPGYLDFDNLPETNFSCQGKVIGGYYADVEAGCQMFHVCTIGQKDEIMDIKFLCLNGTVFDQETRVCERVDEVDCSKSERFYNLNLELYGNNAVTLSLHEQEDEDDSAESREDQQPQQHHMTSVHPSTTTTTTTTTSRPSQPSTTSASNVYQQHPTGYPQHYQPRPAFPSVQTSQSNTHYDDKNGGYHHQYIFHNDERNNNNQATSYQLFSNQGVSSTTPTPQVHQQVRYSSTANPQVIHNEPSTVTPLQYHVQSTSSTIQTLLNSNSNNPSIINPLFHNHGIASTTEQFNVHNNSPREITEYQDNSEDEHDERDERRPLEAVQSTNKGKVSKLSISPVPQHDNRQQVIQSKSSQTSQQQQQRISINYLPTPTPIQTTINAFYPTQRSMTQKSQKTENNQPQHIHVPPPPPIPQLKPHQITINLPPPDIQRIVQNPSPLLPSQSRVIVTAKASVSDESGRPLNASQLITLPLPTIPSNYDDYKEGDESFDPFYRDVPKIRNDRRIIISRKVETNEGSSRKKRSADYQETEEGYPSGEVVFNTQIKDIKDLKENLPIIKAFLFGLPIPTNEKSFDDVTDVKYENVNVKNVSNISSNTNKTRSNTTSKDSKNTNYENIKSSIRQIQEYEDEDVDVPDIVDKEVRRSRTNSRFEGLNGHEREPIDQNITPPNIHRNQFNNTAIVTNHADVEPKDTVQLFLRTVEGNNSISNNSNISNPIENINSLNETLAVIDSPNKGKPELLQTRTSLNSNKSNKRKTSRSRPVENSEEYIPRRNSRVSQPKSSPYYDDYDISESTEELASRHRSNRLRQRPSNRRRINYRDDYIDEDDIGDVDYEEESVILNRKSASRRGPQGRRAPYRNRNRHYDYEDDKEVGEKTRGRTKDTSHRSRVKVSTERYYEEISRNPESDGKKNSRKRPTTVLDDELTKTESDSNNAKTDETLLKTPKDVQKNAENLKSSLRAERLDQHEGQLNKQHKSLSRGERYEEERDQIKDDYLDERETYLDEYNESDEGITDEYIDYPNSREILSKPGVSNRRNRNRVTDDSKSITREKLHRQDKSRKFINETKIDKNDVTEKIIREDFESSTLPNNQEFITTNVPSDYTIPEEEVSSQEYGDYNLPRTTLTVDNLEDSDVTEPVKSTTEHLSTDGVFKFTDELPQTDKKDDIKDQNEEIENIPASYEDYVDDNYEPESYTDPQINKPSLTTKKPYELNNKRLTHTEDRSKDIESRNDKKTVNNINNKSESKEYDEVYDDKLDSTTAIFSVEYDDLETTTELIHASTTSVPILISTAVSTTPSFIEFSVTTTPSTTTTSTTESTTTTTTTRAPLTSSTSTTTTTTTTRVPLTSSTSTTTSTTTSTPIPATPSTRAKTTTKYFKPTAFRKNYVYIPPATTPNPVVIRRGQPLAGPKPTKPPPSYNELAPKPVIRRLPLLSRTTTTTSEATIVESEIDSQLSKDLMEEISKDAEENYPPNFKLPLSPLETVTTNPSSTRPSSIKLTELDTTTAINQEIVKDTLEGLTTSKSSPTEQTFDNEVPKLSSDSQDSNNVPETANDSTAEMTRSNEDSFKLETTTTKVESSYKLSDVQTTTLRTFKPSERRKLELTSVKSEIQKTNQGPKRAAGFNCLEKEMYRFYGDVRDCRLFHYCSPGFTTRQVLDFRFVCEEGTIFDEESQSCRHDVPNPKCSKRTW